MGPSMEHHRSTKTTNDGWTRETLDVSRAEVGFSKQARGEMRDFLAGHQNEGRIEEIAVRRSGLPRLADEIDGW